MDAAFQERLTRLFPRFGMMTSDLLEEFLQRTEARIVEDRPREFIIRKGVPVTELSCLLSGWAARYVVLADGRRQILALKLPGSYICVHALCTTELPFSVQTLTSATRLAMNIDALIDTVRQMPAAQPIFYAIGCHDLADAEDKIIGLGRRDATERISRLILKLYTRLRAVGLISSPEFDFPLRQSHIADSTGLTTVHVNRILQQLRAEGIITLAKGAIEIHDLDALIQFADMSNDELNPYPVLPRGWNRLLEPNDAAQHRQEPR